MSGARNGQDRAFRQPSRRLRFDDLATIVAGHKPGGSATVKSAMTERGCSGRRFVLVTGFTVLLSWGMLYLVFHDWRERYRQRALYGATQVIPAIDPLQAIVPVGVDPAAWRDAVSQTRAMLLTVTSSNLLNVKEMTNLRIELDQLVARANGHPEAAMGELAEIWNQMTDRAEFLFKDSRSKDGDRHPRPKILPPKPERRQARSFTPGR